MDNKKICHAGAATKKVNKFIIIFFSTQLIKNKTWLV